jgi:N-acyl-L-homoserine lactone synthetase
LAPIFGAPGHRQGGGYASPIANALGSGLLEWAFECGVSIIIEIEPTGLLPLVQLHFQPLPLGLPHKINGREVLAVTLTFDGGTLERFRKMRGDRRRVLAVSFERPALLHA